VFEERASGWAVSPEIFSGLRFLAMLRPYPEWEMHTQFGMTIPVPRPYLSIVRACSSCSCVRGVWCGRVKTVSETLNVCAPERAMAPAQKTNNTKPAKQSKATFIQLHSLTALTPTTSKKSSRKGKLRLIPTRHNFRKKLGGRRGRRGRRGRECVVCTIYVSSCPF